MKIFVSFNFVVLLAYEIFPTTNFSPFTVLPSYARKLLKKVIQEKIDASHQREANTGVCKRVIPPVKISLEDAFVLQYSPQEIKARLTTVVYRVRFDVTIIGHMTNHSPVCHRNYTSAPKGINNNERGTGHREARKRKQTSKTE